MVAPEDSKPTSSVVRDQFDWTTISPASAVVETLSRALDCGPTGVGPLYDSIDPDALNSVVTSNGSSTGETSTVISFWLSEHQVAVHGSGDVVVRTNAAACE